MELNLAWLFQVNFLNTRIIYFIENGDIYTWGKGLYGLNGDGKSISKREPSLNEYIKLLREENPFNEIVKMDIADESCTAMTRGGKLYSWGKNDRGQLGSGAGSGVEYTEGERYPVLVENTDRKIVKDFCVGDGTLMFRDTHDNFFRSGHKISYTPEPMDVDKNLNIKLIYCGNSFFSIITRKIS